MSWASAAPRELKGCLTKRGVDINVAASINFWIVASWLKTI